MKAFPRTSKSDRGASMVEYGLMVAVVALVALASVTLLGEKTDETFTTIAVSLEDDGTGRVPGGSNGESDEPADTGDSGTPGGGGGDTDPGNQNGDDQGQNQDNNDPGNQQGDDEPGEQLDNGDDDDELNNGGPDDDESNNGGSNGGSDDDVEDEDETSGPSSNPKGTSANLTWWNGSKNNGNGAWQASVSYGNETNRHQYLKLEITRVNDKGETTTTVQDGFYVPANGTTTFSHWDNQFRADHGKLKGVVEVQVRVLTITTSDQNWQPFTYPVDEQPTKVLPPSPK